MNKQHYFDYARLTFMKKNIDSLNDDESFTIYVRNDNETFTMTKKDFYETFSNVVNSKSYKSGNYNYLKTPSKAYKYLVKN